MNYSQIHLKNKLAIDAALLAVGITALGLQFRYRDSNDEGHGSAGFIGAWKEGKYVEYATLKSMTDVVALDEIHTERINGQLVRKVQTVSKPLITALKESITEDAEAYEVGDDVMTSVSCDSESESDDEGGSYSVDIYEGFARYSLITCKLTGVYGGKEAFDRTHASGRFA